MVIASGAGWASLMHAAAELYTFGCNVDWRHADAPYGAQPLVLPEYPMKRKRCWWGGAGTPQHVLSSMWP